MPLPGSEVIRKRVTSELRVSERASELQALLGWLFGPGFGKEIYPSFIYLYILVLVICITFQYYSISYFRGRGRCAREFHLHHCALFSCRLYASANIVNIC